MELRTASIDGMADGSIAASATATAVHVLTCATASSATNGAVTNLAEPTSALQPPMATSDQSDATSTETKGDHVLNVATAHGSTNGSLPSTVEPTLAMQQSPPTMALTSCASYVIKDS